MSEAIACGGAIYLLAAGLLVAAAVKQNQFEPQRHRGTEKTKTEC
jgi:hypothetical protein